MSSQEKVSLFLRKLKTKKKGSFHKMWERVRLALTRGL